jgi:hypothetical protein
MRNLGRATWQQGVSTLNTIDPLNPENESYISPFASAAWRTAQQPATLTQLSAATGQSGMWNFTAAAPANLAAGTYQLAVEPRQADGTPIPTDRPLSWTITVLDTAPAFTHHAFLPVLSYTAPTVKCP